MKYFINDKTIFFLRHREVMAFVSYTLSEMEFEFELRHPASEFPFLIPVQHCKYVDHI